MSDQPGGVHWPLRWPLLLMGGACLLAIGLAVGYGLRLGDRATKLGWPDSCSISL